MKKSALLYFLAVWVVKTAPLSAQWMRTDGITGGVVLSVLAVDDKLFAGTFDHSLLVSPADGAKWTECVTEPAAKTIYSLFACSDSTNGNMLLAGTGNGVIRSTDQGDHWQYLPQPPFGTIPISCFSSVLDRDGKYSLLAGTQTAGVFRSKDYGTSWQACSTGLQNAHVCGLVVTADSGRCNLYAGIYGGGVYLSSDYGETWQSINAGLTDLDILAIDQFTDASKNIHLIAASDNGIFITPAGNINWQSCNTGLTNLQVWALAVLTENGSTQKLFAGTSDGIFTSVDNGWTWTEASAGLNWRNINCLKVHSRKSAPPLLYAGTNGGGVYVSDNDGQSWRDLNSNLFAVKVNKVMIDDHDSNSVNYLAGTAWAGIFKFDASGNNWQSANTGLTSFNVRCLSAHSNGQGGANVFAGTDYGAFVSDDRGKNWRELGGGLPARVVTSFVFCLNNAEENIFAATSRGVYLSTDNGESWIACSNGLVNKYVTDLLVFQNSLKKQVLLAGTRNGIYQSDDYGVSWTETSAGLPAGSIILFVQSMKNKLNGYDLFAGTESGRLFRSMDDGLTWQMLNTPQDGFVQCLLPVALQDRDGTYLMAGMKGSGFLISMDNGANWTADNSSLTNLDIFSLAFLSNSRGHGTIYAATNNGVWKRDLSNLFVSVDKNAAVNSTRFSLIHNYPNPFNASTTISFEVPVKSRVSVTIHNYLGQLVATLHDQEMDQGTYTEQWQAPPNLASGVYFFRLQAGSFIESKKLLLLR